MRLVEQFERQQAAQQSGMFTGTTKLACAPLAMPDSADAEECLVCNRESQTPPSTWVLLAGLWRFAQPYQWQLLMGFLLTLGFHRRHPGAALPDHALDGQGADSLPERPRKPTPCWWAACWAVC